jgi:hypothetical protein
VRANRLGPVAIGVAGVGACPAADGAAGVGRASGEAGGGGVTAGGGAPGTGATNSTGAGADGASADVAGCLATRGAGPSMIRAVLGVTCARRASRLGTGACAAAACGTAGGAARGAAGGAAGGAAEGGAGTAGCSAAAMAGSGAAGKLGSVSPNNCCSAQSLTPNSSPSLAHHGGDAAGAGSGATGTLTDRLMGRGSNADATSARPARDRAADRRVARASVPESWFTGGELLNRS